LVIAGTWHLAPGKMSDIFAAAAASIAIAVAIAIGLAIQRWHFNNVLLRQSSVFAKRDNAIAHEPHS